MLIGRTGTRTPHEAARCGAVTRTIRALDKLGSGRNG
jgi:hypothetical protein